MLKLKMKKKRPVLSPAVSILTLSLALTMMAGQRPAWGQDIVQPQLSAPQVKSCDNEGTLAAADKLLQEGQIQEAIWALMESKNPEDQARAQKLKDQLRADLANGEIAETKPLNMGGKHSSFKLKFKSGISGVWKPYTLLDISMDYQAEVAAFDLDNEVLHWNMVPMTIKTRKNRQVGSLQLFINNAKVARELPVSEQVKPKLLRLFDFLIRGTDRNPGNYLFKDGRVVAIDHGWTFRPWDLYHQPPGTKMWSLDKGKVFEYLPSEAIYEQLLHLDNKLIRKALGRSLSRSKVNDFIARKDLFVYKVGKRIKEMGRDEVFKRAAATP